MKGEGKYLSSALLLLLTSVIVKIIGAVYKIPLTAFIGAVGRGYFAAAYNLYLPLHAVLMGAFPIALSRLVSKYNATGDKPMLASLLKAGRRLFVRVGLLGMLVLMLAAKPYAAFVASSPKSVYTVYVLAPSLLFSCLAACYRGYFEGYMNMRPTAVSQTLEAVFKLLFGLLFARLTMQSLTAQYAEFGMVFANRFSDEAELLSYIYPFTSAAAMLGVTLGSAVSYLYTAFYYARNRDRTLPRVSAKNGRRALLSFSFPILLSCAVQSVFQFLDTASVQYALGRLPLSALKAAYPAVSQVVREDAVPYVFGLFSAALDFKNLVPGITMALGVCAVPALCREYERKNGERLAELMQAVYQYTAVLACFGGGFLSLCGKELLTLFYGNAPDIVSGCSSLVFWFGFTAVFYSLASTAVFCVQALGKPERSVAPYIVSGALRTVLNLLLVGRREFVLLGAVLSGAVGYSVLFFWNATIARQLSSTRFPLKNAVIKPVFVMLASFFFAKWLTFRLLVFDFLPVNLLIKTAVFGAIYCILCFFVKLLNFKQIFCVLKLKKMA